MHSGRTATRFDAKTAKGESMTDYHDVRDALCKMRDQPSGPMGINGERTLTDWAAFTLAPHFVRALRAAGGVIGDGMTVNARLHTV